MVPSYKIKLRNKLNETSSLPKPFHDSMASCHLCYGPYYLQLAFSLYHVCHSPQLVLMMHLVVQYYAIHKCLRNQRTIIGLEGCDPSSFVLMDVFRNSTFSWITRLVLFSQKIDVVSRCQTWIIFHVLTPWIGDDSMIVLCFGHTVRCQG